MTSLFDYGTSRLSNPGLAAIEYALNRVQALSTKHSEQAEIISLGATAWAYGITPEMMDVFGRIASSMRLTIEDAHGLALHGITPLPLYDAVKRYAARRKPWLGAKDGEVWELTANGDTGAALATTSHRRGIHLAFQFSNGALIDATDDGITAGHRIIIWREPETGGDQ